MVLGLPAFGKSPVGVLGSEFVEILREMASTTTSTDVPNSASSREYEPMYLEFIGLALGGAALVGAASAGATEFVD